VLDLGRLVIEAAKTTRRRAAARDVAAYLAEHLETAQSFARSPISGFRVGAVGLGASGRTYLGFNVEREGGPLHVTVHAEQTATALASARGDVITDLLTSAPPCGHCRQFLSRHAPDIRLHPGPPSDLAAALPGAQPGAPGGTAEVEMIMRAVRGADRVPLPARADVQRPGSARMPTDDGTVTASGLKATPHIEGLDLGPGSAALVLSRELIGREPPRIEIADPLSGWDRQVLYEWSPRTTVVTPSGEMSPETLLPGPFGPSELGVAAEFFAVRPAAVSAEPVTAARDAARRAWCPVTGARSGVALATEGRVVAGPFLESVAFNPSVPALAAALVMLRVEGLDPSGVERVVLAEAEGSRVRYADWTRAAAAALFSAASFEVVSL
jgi:cytidine deaminase